MNYKLVQNYTVTKALNTKDHDPLILAGPFVALTIAENHLIVQKKECHRILHLQCFSSSVLAIRLNV